MNTSMRIPALPRRLILAVLLLAPPSLLAVPLGSALSYQGELRDGGAPANGLYDIRACLHAAINGGTPLICAPIQEDVPVQAGLFTVALDFGSTPFNGEENWLELAVRPGEGGEFVTLTPRQLLRAVPEALRARAMPWTGLVDVPAGFADGIDNVGAGVSSITAGSGLSGGTITSSGTIAIAFGGVDSSHVADGSLLSDDIEPDGLGADAIAPNAIGASELANAAVDSDALQNFSVTRQKLAPGAVGGIEIDANQVQRRVQSSCPVGSALRAIANDGSVQCEAVQGGAAGAAAWGPLRQELDLIGPRNPDVVFAGNGLPIIALQRAAPAPNSLNIDLISCLDVRCAQWQRIAAADTLGGDLLLTATGLDGHPLVLHRSVTPGSVRMLRCQSMDCRGGVSISPGLTPPPTAVVGLGFAVAPDGLPAISYVNDQGQLVFRRCSDVACLTAQPPETPQSAFNASLLGAHTSIAYATTGLPVIAYTRDESSGGIGLITCNNATCGSSLARALPGYRLEGARSLLADRPGTAVVAAQKLVSQPGAATGLVLVSCALGQSCDSSNIIEQDVDVGVGVTVSQINLARGPDGLLLVSYRRVDAQSTELRLARCTNRSCSEHTITALDVVQQSPGREARMALSPEGLPFVVHVDDRPAGAERLATIACNTRSCQ